MKAGWAVFWLSLGWGVGCTVTLAIAPAAAPAPNLKGWTVEYRHIANGLSHSSVECESPVVDAKRRVLYCPAEDWDAQGFTPKED